MDHQKNILNYKSIQRDAMLKKQVLLVFFFLGCSRSFIASDVPNDKHQKYRSILAQTSAIPQELKPYSSIYGDQERHEITLPNGACVIIKRQQSSKSLPTVQSTADGRYVFVTSSSRVRVFKLLKDGTKFVCKTTLTIN